jgi:tetratricopeptide (TPR) repeat protein
MEPSAALEKALADARQALAVAPDTWLANAAVGSLLAALGRPTEGLPYLERALALDPSQADVLNNTGAALRATGRAQEATELFRRAIALDPRNIMALRNLANARSAHGEHEAAIADLQAFLADGLDSAEIREQLGASLWLTGRTGEGLAHVRRSIELDPHFADGHGRLGLMLSELGDIDAAKREYLTAIAAAPHRPGFYRALAHLDPAALEPHHLAALDAMDDASFEAGDRAERHFALAYVAARAHDYERAFQHFAIGNASQRSVMTYDERVTLDAFKNIAAVFTPRFIAGHAGVGANSDLPIFIVGMPRSGTTLVEQFLASHPSVAAGGELYVLEPLVDESHGNIALRETGERYLARLREIAPAAARVTDKMPANFRFLGLIHMALPNARIIHVRRDPLDTCMSCFSQLFSSEALAWTYDLRELGRYYCGYSELMQHWRQTLSPAVMLEVKYEELVENFESEARRLVAFCGLEWNEQCREFYRADRRVRTASVVQVRRPLYRTSIGNSRNYLPFLGPLVKELQNGVGIAVGMAEHGRPDVHENL